MGLTLEVTRAGIHDQETESFAMSEEKSVFVVDLNYIMPLEEVDLYILGHVAFLEDCYSQGLFLASGAKVPRTGGVIIAQAVSQAELEACLARDPFHAHKVAEYKITEFTAKKRVPNFFE